jgi:hypothetical protein
MKRARLTDQRWEHILRVVDETFEDYLTGLVALRHGVVADLKRKLTDRQVRDVRDSEQRSSRASRPSAAWHPYPRGRRPRT